MLIHTGLNLQIIYVFLHHMGDIKRAMSHAVHDVSLLRVPLRIVPLMPILFHVPHRTSTIG